MRDVGGGIRLATVVRGVEVADGRIDGDALHALHYVIAAFVSSITMPARTNPPT
ncbi:MAG: hypothetical protein JO286_08285 [Solirubrobacterales bacterium]|nr:hypothetical protein [Solirubrobacterales bacterium]MBV9807165.1 hypothetical protein [Solirubrobacterales bacterium]